MSARKSDLERSAADQILLAIEQHDFDGDIGTSDNARRGFLCRLRHLIAERDAGGARECKGLCRRIRCHNTALNLFTGAGCRSELGQRRQIDDQLKTRDAELSELKDQLLTERAERLRQTKAEKFRGAPYYLSEEDIAAVEKLMVDEQIPKFETAVSLYRS